MNDRKRIVVTGAGGFIGNEVCKQLVAQNAVVLGLIRSRACNVKVDQILSVDLARDDIKQILQNFQPDAIIHCAGKIREPHNLDGQAVLMRDNYEATAQILNVVQRLTNKPVVVFVSTAAIYAPMETEQKSISESHPWRPSGYYGLSKAAATMLANIALRRREYPVRIAIPFNVIGVGQEPTMVPLAFINQLASHPDKICTGDLSAVRDFIDVRDVASALIALTGPVQDGIYNVSSGIGVSIGQVLDTVSRQLEIKPHVHAVKSTGEVSISVGNSTKIRQSTSWAPKFRLDETLHQMLNV